MNPPHLNRWPVESRSAAPELSVIVPVFNEERTVETLIERVLEAVGPTREVIVVDDGSRDRTGERLERFRLHPDVMLLRHEGNQGKGTAVRTALAWARGEVTIIQDADLEYDPREYPRIVGPILRQEADVVYGSRYLAPSNQLPWTRFRVAVALLNSLVWLLYGRRVTDAATCYKAMRTNLLRELDLQARRFELCPEITGKLCRYGVPILEVPITYAPRTCKEGKKIGWRDAWEAAWTLCRWRIARVRRLKTESGRGRPRVGVEVDAVGQALAAGGDLDRSPAQLERCQSKQFTE